MSISERVTDFFVSRAIISDEDREVYQYGLELLLADLLNFSLLLIIGALASQLLYSIIYMICFVGLRSFCGGYHAKSHIRCHISTIGVFVIFLFLNGQVHAEDMHLLIITDLFLSAIVVCFAPLPHANKPLSVDLRRKNRKRAIVLYYFLTLISLLLCHYGRQEGVAISLTLWIVSLSMIPAIDIHLWKRRKRS